MPGITNPAEEYFKDGLWAWAATLWEKLISSGGRLFTALHGWDGSAWRKLPLVFGYSDGWAEAVSGVAVGAGNASANTTVVPPGSIYVLQAVSISHNAAANKELTITAILSGVSVTLFNLMEAVPSVWYPTICNVVLKPGDKVNGYAKAPGDGKTCYLQAGGYEMLIAE